MVQRDMGRLFWGLVLAALGVVWLLNNFGATNIDIGDLFRLYWPVFLIYFGVIGVLENVQRTSSGQGSGFLWGSLAINLIAALLGVAFLGNIHGWFQIDLGWIWKLIFPAFLLLIGFTLLTGSAFRPRGRTIWAVMGGGKQKLAGEELTDLAVIAVMGGSQIDLHGARLPEEGQVFYDLYACMGGIDLKVPEDIPVSCEWTGVMGGINCFGRERGGIIGHAVEGDPNTARVRIRVRSIMGGFKIDRF